MKYVELTVEDQKTSTVTCFSAPLTPSNTKIISLILYSLLGQSITTTSEPPQKTRKELNVQRRTSPWYQKIREHIQKHDEFSVRSICQEHGIIGKTERQKVSQALRNMKKNDELQAFETHYQKLAQGNKMLVYTRKTTSSDSKTIPEAKSSTATAGSVGDIGEYYGLPPEKWVCPEPDCGKRFRSKALLKLHLKDKHYSLRTDEGLEECKVETGVERGATPSKEGKQ